MNERGMEAFTAIVMGQTLGRAAELLNLTQSAVSHRLKDLEAELGAILRLPGRIAEAVISSRS